jgi:NitT/TauT family transport system substrate-binding protein
MRLTAGAPTLRPITSGRFGRRRRRGAVAVAGLSALLLAAGCSSGSGGSSTSQAGGTITVAAVPGVDNVPLFLAQQKGLFRSAGLNVEIRKYTTVNAEVQALASGQVDVAAGDYGPFLFAESQQKTAGIKIVADGYDAGSGVLEVLTLPGSNITSPEQLESKTIAAPDTALLSSGQGQATTTEGKPDSLETAAATSVLGSFGVDTVTWDPMKPSAEVSALRRHQVPAILVGEPYIYQAESQLGAVEVFDACSGATATLPLSGYFAMGTWASQHAGTLANYRSVLQQAQTDSALAGPVESVLPRYADISASEAAVLTIGTYPSSTNVGSLQRVSQLMFDEGMLTNPVNINDEYLSLAQKKLAAVVEV